MASGPKPGSRWRHYKGGEYTVVCTAVDEQTLEPRVVYRATDGTIWDRRLSIFLGLASNAETSVLRFTPIPDLHPPITEA